MGVEPMTCRLRSGRPSDASSCDDCCLGILWAPMRSKYDDQLLTSTETNLVVVVVSTSAPSMHPTRLERVTYSSVVKQYGSDCGKRNYVRKIGKHAKVAKNWLRRLFIRLAIST